MDKMLEMNAKPCSCGKEHRFDSQVVSGSGAVDTVSQWVRKLGGRKVYVLSDRNTYAAAGERVCRLLAQAGLGFVSFSFDAESLEPDEYSVGAAMMHLEKDCNLILGVGSGVINDIGKLVSTYTKLPYIIVATAPSMDGYASATSSMNRDGLKVSLNSRAADVIIGDSQILCQAPKKSKIAGLGDMLAKYVSICEWRISHLINGEYYCEEIAQLVRRSVKRCVDNAPGLCRGEEIAAQAVFEGLVVCGVAMNYAGLSRPASGVEHYISHVLDMRGVAFGQAMTSHGEQCALGTLTAVRLYERLKTVTPNREKALSYALNFDYEAWARELRRFLGKGAEAMIALEAKGKMYDFREHGLRLERILEGWGSILQILEEELPASQDLERLMQDMGMPLCLEDFGVDNSLMPMILRVTKDIRDKYIWSRLAWDLGILEDMT